MSAVLNFATARAEKPVPLRAKDVENFLARYKEAWETRNAELAASLFTRDARYFQGPFGEPVVGREAIHDYWNAATHRQSDIQFAVKNCVRDGFKVVVEWSCTFTESEHKRRKELAGMFIADFWGKQVRTFREYWVSRTL